MGLASDGAVQGEAVPIGGEGFRRRVGPGQSRVFEGECFTTGSPSHRDTVADRSGVEMIECVRRRQVQPGLFGIFDQEPGGFMIAQARLGPGRIHHCMRAIGMAERAFKIMCRNANEREAFGSKLADKQFIQEFVATSRMEINQARLLTQYAAWKMDTIGKREARQELSMTKVVVPNMMMQVLDRALQSLGALGMSDDTPIAAMWRNGRSLRIADGPDEVHKMVIARRELRRFS